MRMIHVLRKPLSESTVAANTLRHGTGGLNIDASRISSTGDHMRPFQPTNNAREVYGAQTGFQPTNHAGGRWPANVVLQHLEGCRCEGTKRVKASAAASGPSLTGKSTSNSRGVFNGVGSTPSYSDKDGKETVADWACEPSCPVARLDEQSGVTTSTGGRIGNAQGIYTNQGRTGWGTGHEAGDPGFGDTGGASRFYKQIGGEK